MMERVALLVDAAVVTARCWTSPAAATLVDGAGRPGRPGTRPRRRAGRVERTQLLEALDETFWNVTRAARRLGISRDTLRYRITKHRLRPGGARPGPAPERVPEAAPASPPRPATVADAPAATVRWEPRRVTLLRAVIDGPGSDDGRLYPSRLIEALIEKARSFGGRVEDLGPSGIVATFGLEPVEDATRRAAHAAIAMRKAVERERRAEPPWITIRLGIHVDAAPGGVRRPGHPARARRQAPCLASAGRPCPAGRSRPDRRLGDGRAVPRPSIRAGAAPGRRPRPTAPCTGWTGWSAPVSGRTAG